MPRMLATKMKEKMVNTSGTNGLPSSWFTSFTMPATKPYQISASDCLREGTVCGRDMAQAKKPMIRRTPSTMKNAELVKEMSTAVDFR